MEAILDRYEVFNVSSREVEGGGIEYTLKLDPGYKDTYIQQTITQTVDIVRNRIDRRGVVEPDIRQQEGGRIQIQMPGMEDAHEAIEVITQMGHLEFKLEAGDVTPEQARLQPDKYEVVYPDSSNKPLVLLKEPALTGDHVADARPQFGQRGDPYVLLELDLARRRHFPAGHPGQREQAVGHHARRRGALGPEHQRGDRGRPGFHYRLVHGAGGQGPGQRVEGRPARAGDQGGRRAPSVPPWGRSPSTRARWRPSSAWWRVLVFMIVYYGLSGIIADMGPGAETSCSSWLVWPPSGPPLTLPGIAGIILTIGMAVDANVIIFERIREEVRRRAHAQGGRAGRLCPGLP